MGDCYVLIAGADCRALRKGLKDNSAADARKVLQAFRKYAAKRFDHTYYRTLLREKADNKAILDGFGWLHEHMRPKDLAFIFLSTHAYGDGTGFGLLPAGYRSGPDWRERIVSGRHLAGLSKLPGPVVLCLDCCQAAYLLNKRHNWNKVVVICGCPANEESYLGGLSVGVIAALSGEADHNKDGQVSIAEFRRFVMHWVKQNYAGCRHPAETRDKNVDRVVLVGPRTIPCRREHGR